MLKSNHIPIVICTFLFLGLLEKHRQLQERSAIKSRCKSEGISMNPEDTPSGFYDQSSVLQCTKTSPNPNSMHQNPYEYIGSHTTLQNSHCYINQYSAPFCVNNFHRSNPI